MSTKTIKMENISLYDLLTVDSYNNQIRIQDPAAMCSYNLIPSRDIFFSDDGLFSKVEKGGLIQINDYNNENLDLDELLSRLDASETSHVVLLEGFAGCGKSTLAQYILIKQLGTYHYDYFLYNYDLEAQNDLITHDKAGKKIKRSSIFSAIKKSFFEQFVKIAKTHRQVIDDYIRLLQFCRHFQPFNQLFFNFYNTDTFNLVNSYLNNAIDSNENSILQCLNDQSEEINSATCLLALDYLFRLSMFKNRIIEKLYICYDNLDAIEDADDLSNFDDILVDFRQLIDEFIDSVCNNGFFTGRHVPRFVILATYRKITANIAKISETKYREVEFDRNNAINNNGIVFHIDPTSAFSYKKIVSQRKEYFIRKFKSMPNISKCKRKKLTDQITSWEMLNQKLAVMTDRYSCLWNKNYRTCSLIANELYNKSNYNFKKCINFIEQNYIGDGHEELIDDTNCSILHTLYGGSSIILSCICKVFNDNRIWTDALKFASLSDELISSKNVSLSRLVLTYIYNLNGSVSLEELFNFFCKDDLFAYDRLCDILSKMLERNSTGVWRRPIYYSNEYILFEKANDIKNELLKEYTYLSMSGKANKNYHFLLCDSGKTYVENLMHEFEFFSNRISNSHNCLYLNDSINEIDTIITEVYNAVSRCCDNSNKLRKKYKKALNINDDEYLSLPIHPITYRSSPQLHTERIIFSHIAYLNRVRLYFVNKNVTNEFEKRKIYNTLFVNHIKNYLTLYGGKILPIYAHRERIYNELFEIVKDIEKATNNNDVDIMFKSISLINL